LRERGVDRERQREKKRSREVERERRREREREYEAPRTQPTQVIRVTSGFSKCNMEGYEVNVFGAHSFYNSNYHR
jgi:hypothetical protein